jgi:hemerythrin-like domain-containing protein
LLYQLLIERVPEQAEMTEEVAHEHQVVQTALESTVAACGTWRQNPTVETGAALAASLDHLNEVLQPHLDEEEEQVVPLATVTLTHQLQRARVMTDSGAPRPYRVERFGPPR